MVLQEGKNLDTSTIQFILNEYFYSAGMHSIGQNWQ